MDTQEEILIWELNHREDIIGWRSEWDVKPGFKVVTFDYISIDGKKASKTFEIPTNQ